MRFSDDQTFAPLDLAPTNSQAESLTTVSTTGTVTTAAHDYENIESSLKEDRRHLDVDNEAEILPILNIIRSDSDLNNEENEMMKGGMTNDAIDVIKKINNNNTLNIGSIMIDINSSSSSSSDICASNCQPTHLYCKSNCSTSMSNGKKCLSKIKPTPPIIKGTRGQIDSGLSRRPSINHGQQPSTNRSSPYLPTRKVSKKRNAALHSPPPAPSVSPSESAIIINNNCLPTKAKDFATDTAYKTIKLVSSSNKIIGNPKSFRSIPFCEIVTEDKLCRGELKTQLSEHSYSGAKTSKMSTPTKNVIKTASGTSYIELYHKG